MNFIRKNKNNFNNIHVNFPSILATLCAKNNLIVYTYISYGAEEAIDSNYAISKLKGEKEIKERFPKSTILRPSIVYSVDDNFTTTFMTILNRLPIFPIYYKGETKFMPIHCSDLTDVIMEVVNKEIKSELIECGGPEILTFREILTKLTSLINKQRILLPVPLIVGKIIANIMSVLPSPLLTKDQLRLLKYDNVYSNKFLTNSKLGVPSKKIFQDEVEKYCYMWREGGQFSTGKYKKEL